MSNTCSNYRGTLDSDGQLSIKSNINDWHPISDDNIIIIAMVACDKDCLHFQYYFTVSLHTSRCSARDFHDNICTKNDVLLDLINIIVGNKAVMVLLEKKSTS